MIRKILFVLFIALYCSIKADAQAFIAMPADSVSVDSALSSGQSTIARTINLQNTSATDTLFMKWRPISVGVPHAWGLSFCDPKNCLSYVLPNGEPFIILPGQVGIYKLDLTPRCVADTAVLRVLTWVASDSANTATMLTWKYQVTTQNCVNAGIQSIDPTQIYIYPNPVRSEMTVNLPSTIENGQIDIYNLIGSKVNSQSASKGKDLDLSSLETGLYVVRISDNGKIIATRKFTKAE